MNSTSTRGKTRGVIPAGGTPLHLALAITQPKPPEPSCHGRWQRVLSPVIEAAAAPALAVSSLAGSALLSTPLLLPTGPQSPGTGWCHWFSQVHPKVFGSVSNPMVRVSLGHVHDLGMTVKLELISCDEQEAHRAFNATALVSKFTKAGSVTISWLVLCLWALHCSFPSGLCGFPLAQQKVGEKTHTPKPNHPTQERHPG